MACSDCPNFASPSFVCVTVERADGSELFYGINLVGFSPDPNDASLTRVTYQVCNCNPAGTPASGVSFASFELCPDSPTINIEETEAINDPAVNVEIRDPEDGEFNFRAVKVEFSDSIDIGECRNVILVYNIPFNTVDMGDFGDGNVGVKIGGGPFGPTTAGASFGLPLLGCPTDGDECPNDCDLVVCGDPTVDFACPIDVCPGFTLVPGSAQAAICSGDIECEELSCQQEVDVTLCGQTFTCCVEIPLRRLFGTLTIVTSAEFTDPCGNQVALCCQEDVDVDVICPFCPGDAFDCADLPALCELFGIFIMQPTQADPGDNVTISGTVFSRCNCEEFTETFTNAAGITLTPNSTAIPYPSTINVSGLTGSISNVTVTLNGFSHTWPSDVDMMLVAPDGTTNTILMSDPDGSTDVTNLTITFDDTAANPVPCDGVLPSNTSATYRPTNCFEFDSDTFPAPAPVPNPTVALSNFNGIDPNGTWSLYIVDDVTTDEIGSGTIASWSITITTNTCL